MASKTIQPSPKVLAARRNGALGGKARAAKYSSEQIKEWSSKGGTTTQEVYGSELGRFANKLRKTVGRYRKPAELCKGAKARTKKG